MQNISSDFAIFLNNSNIRITKDIYDTNEVINLYERGVNKLKEPKLQSYQVYHGPSGFHLIAIIKVYEITDSIANKTSNLFHLKLSSIDMESDILEIKSLFNKFSEQQIYGVAVHPKGDQVIIIFLKSIEKYNLLTLPDKRNSFQLKLAKENKGNDMKISDLKYHPSGKYLVGIYRNFSSGTGIAQTFKLDSTTLNYQIGSGNLEPCVNLSRRNYYLVRNIIEIDKQNGKRAIIGGGMNAMCIWQMQNSKIEIQYLVLNDSQPIFQNIPESRQKDYQKYTNVIESVALTQSFGHYYLGLDSLNVLAYLFDPLDPSFMKTFNFAFPEQMRNEKMASQCVDIPEIGSIACSTIGENFLQINKLDISSGKVFKLITLFPFIKQFDLSNKVLQIFYYEAKSEICVIAKNKIQCHPISAFCGKNQTAHPLKICNQICQRERPGFFWNPITMKCSPCKTECGCSNLNQKFSFTEKKCTVDCSKIKGAVQHSKFEQKCLCRSPLVWFQDAKICRINCSNVVRAKNISNTNKQLVESCECIDNFIFTQEFDNNKYSGGYCKLNCNSTPLKYQGTEPICQCLEGEVWDSSLYSCKARNKFSIPGWSIGLIVVGVLILVLVVGLVTFKKCKNRASPKRQKQSQKNQQDQNKKENQSLPSSQRKKVNEKQNEDIVILQEICVVCLESVSNQFKGECFHHFHEQCYSQLKKRNLNCPSCS